MSFIINVNGYDYPVEPSKFPAGEIHLNILDGNAGVKHTSVSEVIVKAHLRNSDDIMALLLIKNALNAVLFDRKPYQVKLQIPYLPYARQDRRCNLGEAHSLKVMSSIINSMEFDSVLISDPHSDVVGAVINNCVMEPQYSLITASRELRNKLISGEYVIVSPDAGSEKKALEVAKFVKCNMIRATKRRDIKTGKIEHIGFVDEIPKDKNFLIMDDICEKGGTFLPLAKQLRQKHNVVELYVTHGIFSGGLETLLESFDTIHTTDSYFQGHTTDRVKVIKL